MGKEGELWDDSALIKALDHAVSKYKTMHLNCGDQPTIETLPSAASASAAEADNVYMQNDENLSKRLMENTTNIKKTAEILQSKEESPLELHSSEICVGLSNILEHNAPPANDIPSTKSVSLDEQTVSTDLKDQTETTSYSDGPEEYSKLLNKYYEIESQRQLILQQLNQHNNWNNQYSSTSTVEEYQTYVHQPYETLACHCPYGCQSWVVPCNSSDAACSGSNHVDTTCHAKDSQNGNSGSRKDPDFLNTAIAAAEKALALSKQVNRGMDMEIGQIPDNKSATDLDVVLNAWYTAGLYTGKYLSEQGDGGA